MKFLNYDPRGTVFGFMFKDELTPEEIETVRDIQRMKIIVHPAVYRRIKEILEAQNATMG